MRSSIDVVPRLYQKVRRGDGDCINIKRGTQRLLYSAVCTMVTLLVVVGSGLSEAATYYVATNGGDSNPGTQSQPFRTIRKGVSVLRAGDTLYIRAGTYGENIDSAVQTIPTGTSWSNVVTVGAYPGETVQLGYIALYARHIQYIVFDGLIISPSAGATSDEAFYLSNGANHIRVKNCEIKNGRHQGVLIAKGSGGTDFNEFINVNIHDNGQTPGYDHGMYIEGSSNLVERSYINSNVGYGVHVYMSGGSSTSNNVIRNNRIYNNGLPGATSFGIVLSSGNGNTAYNNLVYNNAAGISVDLGSTNAGLYNNTIYSNTAGGYAGIVIGSSSAGASVINNIVYQNSSGIQNNGAGTLLSNNLTTDPKFVNASAFNFQLQSGSPAIGTGVPITGIATDFNGVARPPGGAWDIGAFQYAGSSSPSAPTNLSVFP